MGLVISGGGIGGCGSVANEGVNSEATGHHCGIYLESSHLGTVQWDGEDDGIYKVPEVFGSGYYL